MMSDDEVIQQAQQIEQIEQIEPAQQEENPLVMSRPMPALRLNQHEPELAPAQPDEPEQSPAPLTSVPISAPSPRWIRLLRAATGLLLLVIAWAALLAIVLLVNAAIGGPFKFPPNGLHPLVPLIELLVALWLAVVAGMSILVGAFLLRLALTVRGW